MRSPLRAVALLLAALAIGFSSVLSSPPGQAQADDPTRAAEPITSHDDPRWQAILAEARGQTVFFNGWGGADRIND